ncbi:hypothetical protein L0B53_00465 [Vibrio sp. SS-MA-C1-2]|uniref:CDC27 family protein n=1 Tax=Vibrio sp. SS-MA-C1-2 TaxID=2908646 RepID=UPI001F1FC100|nr:CDC27 family protein [Vibrio sp. SS-MA-C1-2]UJF17285.1 hypothetical protein L0B53_00465 [Vibrio sp. SS-MA-C1-2]
MTEELIKQLNKTFEEYFEGFFLSEDKVKNKATQMKSLLLTELDTGGHYFWLEREAIQAITEEHLNAFLSTTPSPLLLGEWLEYFIQWQLPRLALISVSFLAQFQGESWVLVRKGRIIQQMGDTEQAGELYKKAFEIDNQSASAYFHYAYLMMLNKNADSAIGLFHQCLAIEPNYLGANLNIGYCLQKLERHEEAILFLKKEVDYHPQLSATHLTLIRSLLETNQLLLAEEVCLELLDRDKNNLHALKFLITIKSKLGKTTEVCGVVNYCFNMGYEDLDMLNIYVDALIQLGNWQEALNRLPPLREIDETEPQFIEYEFIANYQLENWQAAHDSFISLSKLWPGAKVEYKEEFQNIAKQLIPILTIE